MNRIKNPKKLTLTLLCVILIGVITAGTTFAYLTSATEEAQNVFTSAENIRATLTEPNWDEAEGIRLVPGKEIRKDPMITNICKIDEYVALRLTFQYGENICDDDACTDPDNDGGTMSQADLLKLLNLVEIDWNSKWNLHEGTLDIDGGGKVTDVTPTLVFYYEDLVSPGKNTAPIFESIRIKTKDGGMTELDLRWLQSVKITENGDVIHDPGGLGGIHIKIEGSAIQTLGFDSAADAADALAGLFPTGTP